jgi:hypothetical protein
MDKARNYYYYGFGQMIGDQDLSASLVSYETSARSGVNLSKAGIHQVQSAWQLLFCCNAPDCICTRTCGNYLYDDAPLLSPAYIRLLEILPGSEDNIECRLHLAKISQAVNVYKALSYT